MADLTLLQTAKDIKDPVQKGPIWTYALETHVTRTMPIANEPSGVFGWDLIDSLPYTTSSTASRALNGEYTATVTDTQPYKTSHKIYGGRVQYDRVLDEGSVKAKQKGGQIRAQANIFTKDVFEGAGGQYLYGIDSYIDNVPLYSSQSIDAGTVSAGAVLTLDMLDEVLSKHNVQPGRTFLYSNNAPTRRISKMSRGQGGTTAFEAQSIRFAPDQFGQQATFYGDVQLVCLKDGKGTDMLSNTKGDGSSTTVYIVTYGEENFTGFQKKPMYTVDMKEISVKEAFDVEWLVGTAPVSRQCISRIRYVKNAVS